MLALFLAVQVAASPSSAPARDSLPFARLVEQLSEQGGYFDTDNLISNESSYLHVAATVRGMSVKGGAYLGVGPDQNFSYIVMARPAIAFIVDLRRDNQLLHLLFKSVFEQSRNRADFLSLLFGRPLGARSVPSRTSDLGTLLSQIDSIPFDSVRHAATHASLVERIKQYGLKLTAADFTTLRRFHNEFARSGLDLRFTSYGRGPRSYYPTIRQLYLERDLGGKMTSFLATEDDFQFLRALEQRGRVIPIVGDFGGRKALDGVGRFLTTQKLGVSVFYTSNVEFYLFRQGSWAQYVENVRALPWNDPGIIIRSYFGGISGQSHPQAIAGYASVQLAQTAKSFLELTARPDNVSYWDLVTVGAIELKK